MKQILFAFGLLVCIAVHGFAQTSACRATIDSLIQRDDSIDVTATAAVNGCEIGDGAWQMIVINFRSDTGGGHGDGTSWTATSTFDTKCLAEGSYTVYATAYCYNGAAPGCYAPPTQTQRSFQIVRTVTLSGASAEPSPTYPNNWDITASYDMPNTGETNRSVTVYDAKTNARLGGCGWLYTPSGTCTARQIDAGCAGELRVEAAACTTPKKGIQRVTVPPGPDAPCVLRSPTSCPDCDSEKAKPGGPINVGGGDVSLTIPLFSIDEPAGSLALSLFYDSERPMYASLSGEMGYGWSHSFAQSMRAIDAEAQYLYYVSPQGQEQIFQGNGVTWAAMIPTRSRDIVTAVGTEYHLTNVDATLTTFDMATGHWKSTTDRWGNTTTASYDAGGNLTTVTDALGRTINIVATGTALQQVTLPGGATWVFGYTDGNLSSIKDPLHGETPWRTFGYASNRVAEPRLLNAMKDDAGVVLESHAYDSADRATTSGSANGRDQVAISYGSPRHVTHQLDGVTTQASDFTVAVTDSHWAATSMSGGCSSCGIPPGETRQYDSRGRVTQRTDALGTKTTYGFDGNNNVINLVEAYGTSLQRSTQYEYSDSSWPALRTRDTVAGPYGNRITSRTWNPTTLTLTEATSGELSSSGPLATYTGTTTFDARHRVASTDGPRTDVSDVVTRTYYPDDDSDVNRRGRLHTVTNAVGLTTTYDDYDVYGTARLITDANGVETTVETDLRGRTTAVVSQPVAGDPNEAVAYRRTTTYDSRDRVTETISGNGNTTGYTYEDGTNRLTDTIRYDSEGNQVERLHLTLNLVGWKVGEESQSCATPAPVCTTWITKRSETYTYTDQGQLHEVVHPDNTKRAFTYDAALRVTHVKDEKHPSANTVYEYDVLNRLRTVTQSLATAPAGTITTTYTYNVQDQLATVTDPNGNVTSYENDDFGRLTKQVSPVTGTTSYDYDPAGNLTTTTDANGATSVRTYDALSRVTTATSTRGTDTETVTWTYDAPAAGAFGIGRLATATTADTSHAFRYERRGLVSEDDVVINGDLFVQTYGYDADGNRTMITYPSGRTANYSFDFADRPATLSGRTTPSSWPTDYVTQSSYLPFGPLRSLTFGNGAVETRTFDQRYRPETAQLSTLGTLAADYVYTPDAAGNLTGIADLTDPGYSRTFEYDDLNRLVTATTGGALWGNGSFTYDAMGNMLTSSVGARSRSFTYSGTTPRIATATDNGAAMTMRYDAAGNELNGPAFATGSSDARTYSPRNLLQQIDLSSRYCFGHYTPEGCTLWGTTTTTIANMFDSAGLLVSSSQSRSVPPGWPQIDDFFYTPEMTLLEKATISSGAVVDFLWFGSRPVASELVGDPGGPRFTSTDHLGTPILQTDSTGAVVWRSEYDPYGNFAASRAGTRTDQLLRFPGQQFLFANLAGDDENYNIFRWYRSAWGRYTQPDPIGLRAGVNLYVFVDDGPTIAADPYGLYGVKRHLFGHDTVAGLNEACHKSTGGACSFWSAWIDTDCGCAKDGCTFKAHAQLDVDLTIHYFTGDFSHLPEAVDLDVTDAATAIAHELYAHVDPAARSGEPFLNALNAMEFDDMDSCIAACSQKRTLALRAFSRTIHDTQAEEDSLARRHVRRRWHH